MTWALPKMEEVEARAARIPSMLTLNEQRQIEHGQPPLLPAMPMPSESYWPTAQLRAHMRHRHSRLWWRRRRAHLACQWLIVRHECALGMRRRSAVEIVMR